MAKRVGPNYHVVAYVTREGEGAAEADVVAHGKLAKPAAPDKGFAGDAVKGVLSRVASFECHGEVDACTETHEHAEERLVVRMQADRRLGVVWRKYHPLIRAGAVAPGQPFEHAA